MGLAVPLLEPHTADPAHVHAFFTGVHLLGYTYNLSLESDSTGSPLRGRFIALDSFTSLSAVPRGYLIAGAQ